MAASMSLSRFAVLGIESSDDELEQRKKPNSAKTSATSKTKKKKNKKPSEKGADQNDVTQ